MMRTYAGHSSAAESNKLYRMNLAKGQTGLSVAFDLPTQTGYDPDSPLSRGEVGKVGVPIPHLGEMRRLFADIPLTEMNTSACGRADDSAVASPGPARSRVRTRSGSGPRHRAPSRQGGRDWR